MTRLVLATANPDKVREIEPLLTGAGVELVGVTDMVPEWEVVETGRTLEDNARLKARAAVVATGEAAVADDTGLFVTELDGAPGVRSSRFAGETATYRGNVELLLDRLRKVPQKRRKAKFRTAVVVAKPNGTERTFEGVLLGYITDSPRGDGGFGYDPVFEPCGQDLTLAELPLSVKNTMSHRARAFIALAEFLMANPDWLEVTDPPV
ncbi:MAG: RdgB/HAM1 family non-canonical purine NTP pyrophosphatase [Gemmatimonadetes bacterium]|nr:RdgB/HAM1 family non-canonical purine NTP pyrophosphatase [Gemmatimonadota bacterium]